MALRGRNTVVELYGPGGTKVLQGEDVVSFRWGNNSDIKEDGYLGNDSDSLEEVYKSVGFTLVLNHRTGAVADFNDFLTKRSKGYQENQPKCKIATEYVFPNGDTRTQIFPDCKFKGAGMDSKDRESNVDTSFDGMCRVSNKQVVGT